MLSPELADETPVTAIVGRDGPTPSDPDAAEEWLKFNASVRRAMGGRTVYPFCRGVTLPSGRRARLNHSHLIQVGEGASSGRLVPAPA